MSAKCGAAAISADETVRMINGACEKPLPKVELPVDKFEPVLELFELLLALGVCVAEAEAELPVEPVEELEVELPIPDELLDPYFCII